MNKKLWIIIILIFLFIITSNQQLDTDKKTSIATTIALTGGVGSLAWMGLLSNPISWVVIGIVGILFLGPGLISSWGNVFNPQPTIPIWVWIVVALFLFIMISKKNK